MLVREVAAHDAALAAAGPVVLDRGVPDVVGFLRISGLAVPRAIDRAARTCRYNPRVFIAPWWEDIFTPDAERKQTPDEGRATFARSEEHTSELQSLMRISYAVFCLQKTITTPPRDSLASATTQTRYLVPREATAHTRN